MSIWSSTTLVIVADPTVQRCVATRVSLIERSVDTRNARDETQRERRVARHAAVSERPASDEQREMKRANWPERRISPDRRRRPSA